MSAPTPALRGPCCRRCLSPARARRRTDFVRGQRRVTGTPALLCPSHLPQDSAGCSSICFSRSGLSCAAPGCTRVRSQALERIPTSGFLSYRAVSIIFHRSPGAKRTHLTTIPCWPIHGEQQERSGSEGQSPTHSGPRKKEIIPPARRLLLFSSYEGWQKERAAS
jgi:hypothetical protein